MPRTLAIDPRVPTSHGIIIRRHTLAEQTRAHITIKEARAYARRIVKDAQLHAESIKQQALQQGFVDGWRDSLETIYQSLRGTEQLHAKVEQTLKQTVHNALADTLQQPALEFQLLEGWLAKAPHIPGTLHLVLPRRAQSQAPAIVKRLQETLRITPTISVGEGDCVVIECGDQLFEFSPSRTLEEFDELVENNLNRLEVKKQFSAWSTHIVQHWLSNLAQRHKGVVPGAPGVSGASQNRIHDDLDMDDE